MKAVPSRSRKTCTGLRAAGISLSSEMLQKTKTPSCISGFIFCSSVLRLPFARHGRVLFQQVARISHRAARLRVRWLIRATVAGLSAYDDFTDLDHRGLVGIVRDVGHDLLGMRPKTGLERLDR